MGRKLGFNRGLALTKATELFWKRGYVNTSLAQLLKAMRLGEGSFYNSFGSKKRLYMECLSHYNSTFMTRRAEALSSQQTAQQRILDFFDVVIDEMKANRPPGCLISNSVSNEVLSERELKKISFSAASTHF